MQALMEAQDRVIELAIFAPELAVLRNGQVGPRVVEGDAGTGNDGTYIAGEQLL